MLSPLVRLRNALSDYTRRNMLLLAGEGVFISAVNWLIVNNNTLLASRLGASDFQLSLNFMLPQIVSMLFLLPGGIITDRLKNKRIMVISALISCCVLYIIIGALMAHESGRLYFYLALYALSTGPMTLYNTSWQSFFSDVTPPNLRNQSLSLRTRISFFIGITLPLFSGFILSSAPGLEDKIRIHQIYLFASAFMFLIQIYMLKKVSGGDFTPKPKEKKGEFKASLTSIVKNKPYLIFVFVAVFFFASWQMDWSFMFIVQTRYLGYNEAWLSYAAVGGQVMQFLTIGFWSRMNEKYGVRFSIIFGSLGLTLAPLSALIATSIPQNLGRPVYLIMNTGFCFAFATIQLNILQCLLQVVDEKNKTLSISIYTIFAACSNALMPMAGTTLYNLFGGDLNAVHYMMYVFIIVRALATGLWFWRWRATRSIAK